MSTRAIVAEPYGDSWRGRHTHSDGYPTYRARHLWALVKRDGFEKVRKTICEDHYGWSVIDAEQADLTAVKVPKSYEEAQKFGYGSPEYEAFNLGPQGSYGDGRFVNVPGYGVAYTTEKGQSDADDWMTPEDTRDSEWAYVVADNGLWVFKTHMGPGFNTVTPPTLLGIFNWNEDEPNWEAVENSAYESAEA